MSKGSFIGQPVMPYVGMNTGVTAPSQPCLDENNSYHPERCDRARCDKPWCSRGRPQRELTHIEDLAQEQGRPAAVTIHCHSCGAALSSVSMWQAERKARLCGWDVRRRLCPACREPAP